MKKILRILVVLVGSILPVCINTQAQPVIGPELQQMMDEPYKNYMINGEVLDKLPELEADIFKLDEAAKLFPNEPRIFYARGWLYRLRGSMLKMHVIYADKNELFSIPIIKEYLQAIRDNFTEAIRLQEAGLGLPLNGDMFRAMLGPTISRQLYERIHKAEINSLPDIIRCGEDAGEDCMTQTKQEVALEWLTIDMNEYISYGFFEDADRLNGEIALLSDKGKEKAKEFEQRIAKARQNYDPDKHKEELALMLPGTTPKPLGIRAADAIAENHRAAEEKAQAEKNKAQEIAAQAASSAAAIAAAEKAVIEKAEKTKTLWILLAGALGFIVVVVGIIVVRRRHAK